MSWNPHVLPVYSEQNAGPTHSSQFHQKEGSRRRIPASGSSRRAHPGRHEQPSTHCEQSTDHREQSVRPAHSRSHCEHVSHHEYPSRHAQPSYLAQPSLDDHYPGTRQRGPPTAEHDLDYQDYESGSEGLIYGSHDSNESYEVSEPGSYAASKYADFEYANFEEPLVNVEKATTASYKPLWTYMNDPSEAIGWMADLIATFKDNSPLVRRTTSQARSYTRRLVTLRRQYPPQEFEESFADFARPLVLLMTQNDPAELKWSLTEARKARDLTLHYFTTTSSAKEL